MTQPPATNGQSTAPQPDAWTPRFLNLPIHAAVRLQLDNGLKNKESTVIVGPRGVGKTHTVRTQLEEIQREELRQQIATGRPPRQVLWYATAQADGTKTILTDIYTKLKGRPMGKRNQQDWTPTAFIQQITEIVKDERYALICIDEAQHIDAHNINHLRQLIDAAEEVGHGLQIILIGNEGLPREVAKTGQLGERFTGFVSFPRFSAGEVAPHLAEFHPGLGALRETLPAKAWKPLERQLFTAVRGSFRRLCKVLLNADELALRRGGPLTEQDVLLAIGKLPPEL